MLEKLPFKIGSFFTYVMYITARVSHLHENGRLSERDKPKASSRELDAVFGIPSSGGGFLFFFFSSLFLPPLQDLPPASCIYFPNNHSGPSCVDYFLSARVTKILL